MSNLHCKFDAGMQHLIKNDIRLAKVIKTIGPLNIDHVEADSFYFLTREIIGQMLSAKVSRIIFERLLSLCNGKLSAQNIALLSHDSLRHIGLSQSKTKFIKGLASAVLSNEIDFSKLSSLSDEDVIRELKKIHGIGNWTAKMYLLFFLQRNDVLPLEDGAFLQTFKWLYDKNSPAVKEIEKICSSWKPYSSIASRYLYIALDSGLTKIPINDFLNNGL